MNRQSRTLRSSRRHARALVKQLHLTSGADLRSAVTAVSAQRAVRIVTSPADLGIGVWGVSIPHGQTVHIFWNSLSILSTEHREVVVAHELGHIMAGHLMAHGAAARRCQDLDLSTEPTELLAEAFAAALVGELRRLRPLAARLDDLN